VHSFVGDDYIAGLFKGPEMRSYGADTRSSGGTDQWDDHLSFLLGANDDANAYGDR
jgi:hypothetical protein